MLFRGVQIGYVAVIVLVGSWSAGSLQAQYPFGGPSYGAGYGYQAQSFYGQQGMFPPPSGNCGSSFYAPGNFAPQIGYAPQSTQGYGGGYQVPALNVNQSFYPGGQGYNSFAPNQHYDSHHSHHSHHPWHLGHYLLGHH